MEQNDTRGKLVLVATGSGRYIAEKVLPHLIRYQEKEGLKIQPELLGTKDREFGDTEIKHVINKSIRGADAYVIADCFNRVYPTPLDPFSMDQNISAVEAALEALVKCEVHHITAVLPYFPYSRQDKSIEREGILARKVARSLEASGAQQIITFDIHNPSIEGFFRNIKTSLEDLKAGRNFMLQIKEDFDLENLVIVAADVGAASRARIYCNHLKVPIAILDKIRDYKQGGKIIGMNLIGDVKGKDAIEVDDMAATCGTMSEGLIKLKEEGARRVGVVVTHPLLNRKERDPQTGIAPGRTGRDVLIELHNRGLLDRFYCGNMINHGDFFKNNSHFITVVNNDEYLAKAIHHLNTYKSISALLDPTYPL